MNGQSVLTQLCEIFKIYVEKCGSKYKYKSATYIHSEEKDWDFCNCKCPLRVPLAEEFSTFTVPMASWTFYINFDLKKLTTW